MIEDELYLSGEYKEIVGDILYNEVIVKMKNYLHHHYTNRYSHSLGVSYFSYRICKKLKWDYVSAARAGMLHDLFSPEDVRSLLVHPKIALSNAKKIYEINKKEEDIILKHMWPLTIAFPKYKESYVVTLIDKCCSFVEAVLPVVNKLNLKKAYRYSYIFLCCFALKVI